MGHATRIHLTHDHRRSERDIDGLPLEAMHRFEHVEQELGLLELGHWHGSDGATRRRRAVDL